jgi:hypothetical protein
MYYSLQAVDQAALETVVDSTQLAIPAVVETVEQTVVAVAEQVVWLKYSTIQLFQAVKLDYTWAWAADKCLKITYSRSVNKDNRVSLVI